MKKKVRNRIIAVVSIIVLIGLSIIGIFVQKQKDIQLAKEDAVEKQAYVETSEVVFTSVKVGYKSYYGIDENGYLWSWGNNDKGQLGNGTTTSSSKPTKIISNTKFIQVDANGYSAMAIDINGNLWAWGLNAHGEFGNGTTNQNETPSITNSIKFKKISLSPTTGGSSLTAVCGIDTSGNLWIWGDSNIVNGITGTSGTTITTSPVKYSSDRVYNDVKISSNALIALDSSSNAYIADRSSTTLSPIKSGTKFKQIDIVDNDSPYIYAIDTSSNLWRIKNVNESVSTASPVKMYEGVRMISASRQNDYLVMLYENGDVYINDIGGLGSYDQSLPNQEPSCALKGSNIKYISAFHQDATTNPFILAIDNNGITFGSCGTYSRLTKFEQVTTRSGYYTVEFENYVGYQKKIMSVASGTGATAPSTSSLTGYTYHYGDKNFSNVTSNLKVKELRTANTYYIKYNANGGTGSMSNSTHQYGTGKALSENRFTKTGYKFIGWTTDNTSSTVEYTDMEKVTSLTSENNKTINLYALWEKATYTVTFVNEGTTVDTQIVEEGQGATAPSLTKAGYVLRWDKEFSNITSDITVNAVWLKDTDGDGIPDIEDDDTQVRYTVEHYVQNIDLTTYTLQETENTLTGNLGSTVNTTPKTYTGFSVVETDETVASGTVVDDESLVLKLYYNRNNYTVTLNKNEGTINSGDVTSYTYGIGVALPTNVTKQGYVFRGWYEDEVCEGTAVTTIGVTETGAKVYYAKWLKDTDGDGIPDIEDDDTQVRYTVEHYVQNTDLEAYTLQETENTLTGNLGHEVTATPKTYTGFSVVETDNTVASGIVVDDGSLVLKLYYNRNNYTVTLNKNEGTINSGDVTSYTYGIGVALPTNVTKQGYVFRGWYEDEACEGTAVTTIGVTETGAKVYYAKWLKDTDGDGIPDIEDDDTQVRYTVEHYVQNTDLTTYTLQETENTLTGNLGHEVTATPKTYTGFSVVETDETVASGTVVDDGSLVLKLYYNRNTYTVTLNKNEGTINSGDVTSYTYGIGVVLPTNVTKQGNVFRGWYDNVELTGTAVTTIGVTETGAKVYYAKWLKDTDGDGIPDIEDDDTQVRYTVEHYVQNTDLTTYTLQETENTLTGNLGSTVNAEAKTYTGFSVVETDNTVASGTVVDDGSLVLKLYYNRNNYAVTLNKNEGTINSGDVTNYTYGIGVALPTNVTKQGYVFRGWYEDEACEGTAVTTIGVTETGAKVYYAKWLKDTDGDGIPDIEDDDTQVRYTVEHYVQNTDLTTYTLQETENTLTGNLGHEVTATPKTYTGFSVVETDETVASGTVVDDGSLVLKLYYNRNTYTVTLNKNEGTINSGDVTSYTYGIGVALPTNVTKQGYVFRGWYEDEACEGTAVTTIGVTETGAKTYYAKWLKDTDGDGIPDIEDDDTQVRYTVEHYKQNIDLTTYTLQETENTLTGNLGHEVTATPKTYTGFSVVETDNTVASGTVVDDGSLVLKLYYNRNTYKLPLNVDGEIEEIEYVYGEEITLPTDKEKEGYTFEGWYDNEDLTGAPVEKVDTSELDPENPPTYYIKWTANEGIAYTVKHYKQEGNTNTYTLADTEELTGTTGETVTARPKTYEGYVENTTVSERIPSGVVKGDGSLELVLIYDTIKLTVTFKDGDTTVDTQTIVYGENAVAPTPTKEGYILRWDKEFNNVKTNLTVNAVWLKDTDGDGIPDIEDNDTQVRYTVEHYVQNTDLTTYTLQETENTLTGNLGSTVNATPKTYTGFTLTQTDSTIANGTVVDDGSLVLKLYYNRNNYAVTLNKNEGTINSGNVLQYTYGIGATLPTNVTKEGYVFRGWYDNANLTGTAVTTIGVTETGAKIYYAKWLKDTDGDGIPDIEDDDTQVRYTVEHYKQNLAQNGYDEAEIENLQGQLGSIVTAQAKTYTGFSVAVTDETVPSGTVVDDGSLVLKLYYDRENYEITYETNGGTIEDDNYATSYTYGIVVSLPLNVTKEGFTFGGWYENIVEEGARAYTRSVEEKTIVSQTKETDTGAKTYYASWNANGNTAYKVEHYKQGETGYILADTDNLTAETESTVTAVPKTYEGYEENINHEERVAEGTVAGNGSLVLKLYYDMLTYEVTFKDGETVLETQTVAYGENAVAPSLAKEGYILRWDKEYNNVTSNLTVNAIWLRDTDGDGIPDIEDDETLVEYIVRHYKQQGNTNTYELVDTETLQGNLGSTVTATPKVYEGYEENITAIERIPSGKITGEETLELRLFYNTIKYEVIFKDGEKEVGRVVVPHGGTAEPPILTKEGYTLSWDKDLRNITENQTINAVWTKVEGEQKTYKVEHYVETKEGKYSLKETQNLVGNIGEAVTASPKTYEEYVLDETNQGTVKTGEIKEGSELTLKLYYNYKKYEVIFKDGEEEVGRVEVIHGEKAEPPELTKPGYILSWDKNINNITKEQTITAVWTVDPNHKDPNAGKDDNKPDNDNPTIDKLPDDGKEEKPSILPKTGEEVVTIGAVIGLLGVAVAYFVKYKF